MDNSEKIYLSIKNNMLDKLNKYYISDISHMIFNYIELDCIKKQSKEHIKEVRVASKKYINFDIFKDIVDLCNNIKSLANKKVVIILNSKDHNGKTTKEHEKYVKFLEEMIIKRIRNVKVRSGKLYCFLGKHNISFGFGEQYYKTLKNPSLIEEKKQKLIFSNQKHNPGYDQEALEACINGFFMFRETDISPLMKHDSKFFKDKKRSTKKQSKSKEIYDHVSPVILSEDMRRLYDNIDSRIDSYDISRSKSKSVSKDLFSFGYMYVEKV